MSVQTQRARSQKHGSISVGCAQRNPAVKMRMSAEGFYSQRSIVSDPAAAAVGGRTAVTVLVLLPLVSLSLTFCFETLSVASSNINR